MKGFVAGLSLVMLPLFGVTPAGAVGYGACTISGTITFAAQTLSTGAWTIGPAVLDCQGLIAARRRIIGRGPFGGAGSFIALPPGGDACLRQSGSGQVDYRVPTSAGEIVVSEPVSHTLAGIGVIDTPTLRGVFELPPPYDGDCVNEPLGRTTFVAEVVLNRYPRELPRLTP